MIAAARWQAVIPLQAKATDAFTRPIKKPNIALIWSGRKQWGEMADANGLSGADASVDTSTADFRRQSVSADIGGWNVSSWEVGHARAVQEMRRESRRQRMPRVPRTAQNVLLQLRVVGRQNNPNKQREELA